ncbi:MAG TPA: aminotransferase class V-fold PLP-dependent enzyme [Planctomycetaceae bacterium]
MTVDDLRPLMPVTARWAYFDHAAVAPLPEPSRRAMADLIADQAENGDANWPRWRKNVERARALGAGLIGAGEDEVAVVRNTTEGIGLVAEGFPWRPGDNVVVPSSEFPSNLYPWKHLAGRGVEVRVVDAPDERLDPAKVEAACDPRTRIVAVSWVGYATGWRNDPAVYAEIAHRRGAYLFLDAIQALGVLPLDAKAAGVDFLAADGHKWMLGPEGAGLFYVRRELLDLLRPLLVGWNSVATAGDYTNPDLRLKPTAGRYEGGSYNMAGIAGFAESLALLDAIGVDAIAARLREVTDGLCDRLRSAGADIASDRSDERRSGIVAFALPGRPPTEVRKHLFERGVIVRERAGRLRASPHAYTNADDVDRLAAALREVHLA